MRRCKNFGIIAILLIVLIGLNFQNSNAADKVSYHQYLIQSLNDENIGRRASAAMLLGEQKTRLAVAPLLKMLQTDQDFRVRIVAAVSLYKLGDSSIVLKLKEVYQKEKNKTVKHVLTGIIHEFQIKNLANVE